MSRKIPKPVVHLAGSPWMASDSMKAALLQDLGHGASEPGKK